MSDPYESAKGGKLSYKGGESIDKMKKQKKRKKQKNNGKKKDEVEENKELEELGAEEEEGKDVYTIDAAKKMKYDELFPVEAKKFGYGSSTTNTKSKSKSVEDSLDDRVKKKADRYCK